MCVHSIWVCKWASTKEDKSLGYPGAAATVDYLTWVPESNLLFARALFTICKSVTPLSPTFKFLIFSDTSTNLKFCSKSPTPIIWTLTLLSLSEPRKFSQSNKRLTLKISHHCSSELCAFKVWSILVLY